MAKTKENTTENLRQLDVNELKGKLIIARKNLFELKLKRSEQKNPFKVRWVRHDVARILTIIKEKMTGGNEQKSK
jgi:ribosomal protein L29